MSSRMFPRTERGASWRTETRQRRIPASDQRRCFSRQINDLVGSPLLVSPSACPRLGGCDIPPTASSCSGWVTRVRATRGGTWKRMASATPRCTCIRRRDAELPDPHDPNQPEHRQGRSATRANGGSRVGRGVRGGPQAAVLRLRAGASHLACDATNDLGPLDPDRQPCLMKEVAELSDNFRFYHISATLYVVGYGTEHGSQPNSRACRSLFHWE